MMLHQVNSKIESTKQQISSVKDAITALKNWEVEFNTYLLSLDAQMKQIQSDTDAMRAKEESLDADINTEKRRHVEFEQENARESQVILTFFTSKRKSVF